MGKCEVELKRRLASDEDLYETQWCFIQCIKHDPRGEWEKMSKFEKIFLVTTNAMWVGKKYQ